MAAKKSIASFFFFFLFDEKSRFVFDVGVINASFPRDYDDDDDDEDERSDETGFCLDKLGSRNPDTDSRPSPRFKGMPFPLNTTMHDAHPLWVETA